MNKVSNCPIRINEPSVKSKNEYSFSKCNYKLLMVNCQQYMVYEESETCVNSIMAVYAQHTHTVTVHISHWSENKKIVDFLEEKLHFTSHPTVKSDDGFHMTTWQETIK